MEMNKTLADEFFTLTPEQRRSVHFMLCEHALEKWNLYTKVHNQIIYIETVTGTHQEVDKHLPENAFEAARQGYDTQNILKRYQEPIVAMQDEDLIFPQNITFAYYAIYNLFKRYVQNDVIEDWLIINQALAVEDNSEMWSVLLTNAIHKAKL